MYLIVQPCRKRKKRNHNSVSHHGCWILGTSMKKRKVHVCTIFIWLEKFTFRLNSEACIFFLFWQLLCCLCIRLQGWGKKHCVLRCSSWLAKPSSMFLTIIILLFRFLSPLSLSVWFLRNVNLDNPVLHPLKPWRLLLDVFVFTGLPGHIRTFNFNGEPQYVKANWIMSGTKFWGRFFTDTPGKSLRAWTQISPCLVQNTLEKYSIEKCIYGMITVI